MFDFLSHQLMTTHRGASDGNFTGLSPRLWGPVTGSVTSPDSSKRLILAGDDFTSVDNSNSYTEISADANYVGYIDTGNTILGAADEKGGVLELILDGTGANDECGIESGDGTMQLGQISDTAADAHMTAFECRIKKLNVTDSAFGIFAGLAGPGSNDGDVLTDTTLIPTIANHGIGFFADTDGDSLNFFYEAAGQTRVDVIEDITLAADTFIKVGFLYDPNAIPSKRIKVFVNNVEQGTYVTATNIAAATFPDAEALTAVFAAKALSEAAAEMSIDWWAFGQVIDLAGPDKVNGDPIV